MVVSVGKSDRTVGKHDLLNKIAGKIAGSATMLAKKRWFQGKVVFIDTCAGDGWPTKQSQTASPLILLKHSNYVNKNLAPGGNSSYCLFVEKDHKTVDLLKKQVDAAKNARIYWGDVRKKATQEEITLFFAENQIAADSICLVSADPNSVSDWPLTNEFLNLLPNYTTVFCTLGCNVGGLKRLRLDERDWIMPIMHLVDYCSARSSLDVCLCRLNGDESQWAYLISSPKSTRWKTDINNSIQSSFRYWEKGVAIAWLKEDKEKFFGIMQELFLTHNEIKAGKTIWDTYWRIFANGF